MTGLLSECCFDSSNEKFSDFGFRNTASFGMAFILSWPDQEVFNSVCIIV